MNIPKIVCQILYDDFGASQSMPLFTNLGQIVIGKTEITALIYFDYFFVVIKNGTNVSTKPIIFYKIINIYFLNSLRNLKMIHFTIDIFFTKEKAIPRAIM